MDLNLCVYSIFTRHSRVKLRQLKNFHELLSWCSSIRIICLKFNFTSFALCKTSSRVTFRKTKLSACQSCCLLRYCFFIEVLLFQWINGVLDNEYTGFPDEAAHYVSSLLIENYITNGEIEHPLAYAKDYYYHYPKVAIGHWPPVMYGMLAIWFIIFRHFQTVYHVFCCIHHSSHSNHYLLHC